MSRRTVITVADANEMARVAADRMLRRMAENSGRIAVCLTGGSSPKLLYELLASEPYRARIPWDRTHWFIGDDRFVPPNDPLNNMRMVRHLLLDRNAPADRIYPIPTDLATPDEAAHAYETTLQNFYGSTRLSSSKPLFDIALMGVGPDGHTASLFPGYPAVSETKRWVVGVPNANVEPFVPRVSLTLPALGSCAEMLFEVSGAGKRSIVDRVLSGADLPSGRAYSEGETIWLCDKAALSETEAGG